MTDSAYRNQDITTSVTHPNWGAIWAGTFSFIGIWAVFGMLGMAIFATTVSASGHSGADVGMGIWAIILTIIAMYVAGRVTGHLAAIGNSREGLIHGMIMFGLSVTAALVVAVLAGGNMAAAGTGTATVSSPYLLGVFAELGWYGFVALFFGWLAALGGASAGTHQHAAATPIQQAGHAV